MTIRNWLKRTFGLAVFVKSLISENVAYHASRFLSGYFFVWGVMVLLLIGCQTEPTATSPGLGAGSTPIPLSPTPTQTILPTSTNTPISIPTSLPPISTAEIVVEDTAVPTPTFTPLPANTPEPSATPTIEGLIGPANFPTNINPLTGEVVRDPDVLNRRPLAIKVSNAPAIVRPQAGLNSADLVFEHYAEGGLTRFTAVFYTHDADPVGSVRSGRLIDMEIAQMYDAAFAFSGASGPIKQMVRESNFFDRVISPDYGHGGFWRVEDPSKAIEHTMFTSTYNLRWILEQRGQEVPPQFQNGMAFLAEPLVPGPSASRIEIGYDGTNVYWSSINGRYYRWTNGLIHTDANTDDQLNFQNIIVLAAHHQNTDFLEDNNNYSIQIQLWGEGPVSVFRDGQRIDGLWQRTDPSHMLTFTDLEGNILPLAPGNTFFQIVPLGFDRLTVTP
jgi:hypothetical protein